MLRLLFWRNFFKFKKKTCIRKYVNIFQRKIMTNLDLDFFIFKTDILDNTKRKSIRRK